ncbi:MAG: NADP-dependent phosphogluconate dehydrogenase [Phycisphaerales bacterium]
MARQGDSAMCDVGMMGLAVMGKNLALNMADHGFRVAAWNRTHSKAADFEREGRWTPGGVTAAEDVRGFVKILKRPRIVTMLVKAGEATDWTIDQVKDFLEPGDVIVDGGNAHWDDTNRRERELRAKGLLFVGSGVSGGELGARFGPSLMAGGDEQAWDAIRPIWEAIAAKVDEDGREIPGAAPGKPVKGGTPCAAHIGPGGAGHYVKLVHNGIEYADMQTICEAYDLLRRGGEMSPRDLSGVFGEWNRGELESYLIEITADILAQRDPRDGDRAFVDAVLDAAGQKGTGKWTAISALDLGACAPTIAEAVFARNISALVEERVQASGRIEGPTPEAMEHATREHLIEDTRDALLCAKIVAYAQGFALIDAAAKAQGWKPPMERIARIWRGGCIIRARLLSRIMAAYERDGELPNLLLDPEIGGAVSKAQAGWRRTVARAATMGVPTPTLSSALAYFDAFRAKRLPASLLQAQRDYFGAHTYERVDEPRGSFFHLDWPESGRPEVRA